MHEPRFADASAARILVVDDEEIIREFLHEFLTQEGYDVHTADNGEAGLHRIREWEPEIVISDVNMPRLGGMELLTRLREETNPPPVILLTGYADIQTAIHALKLGAFDYMLKPVSPDELLNRVRHLLYMRMLERRSAEERRKSVQAARMAAIGNLAAGVAHEINNPTTFLRGNTQILSALLGQVRDAKNGGDPAQLHKSLDKLLASAFDLLSGIENGTSRIAQITRGLIHFADMPDYATQADIDFLPCVEQALALWEKPDHPIRVETDLAAALPPVRGHAQALSQALLCLLQNARQAVEGQDSPRVRISLGHDDPWVWLAVEDSGPGIPQDLREQVFEPFFTTREVGQGAGLGLAVVYGIIVNDHHGEIKVGESPLGGARFLLRLRPHRAPAQRPAPLLEGV